MHSPLEKYLDAMEVKLRSLPREQRESDLAELRQHLESLVAAYKELEYSDAEAVTLAIQQFGPPKTVAGKLLHASRRADRRQIGSRLCMAGWALFLISLLLPTMSVFGSTLRGYDCAFAVMYPLLPLSSRNLWDDLYYHGLGLANVLMLASPILFSALKRKRQLGITSVLFALSAAMITPLLFNSGWGIGFYVWCASFGLVTAGSIMRTLSVRQERRAIE